MNYKLAKSERLCSKKQIEALFGGGNKSMSSYPIRAVFMLADEPQGAQRSTPATLPAAQVLLSVSKRHFKHAVDRNRVKRQLREAYRLNKHLLLAKVPEGRRIILSFIWLSDEQFDSSVVQSKMQKLLLRITEEM